MPAAPGGIVRITRIAGGALGLALGVTVLLGGCATPSASSAPGKVVTISGTEPTGALVPANVTDPGGARVVSALYAGLVTYNSEGIAVDDAARSIVANVDFTVYTVSLEPKHTFSNGEKVTAESFVRAWDWAADAANAAADRSAFMSIKGYVNDDPNTPEVERSSLIESGGLVVLNDSTFEVHLRASRSDFVSRLGTSAFFPLPSVFFDNPRAFGRNPIGNGPYKMAGAHAWEPGEQLSLAVNPSYSGPRTPRNGGLRFIFEASNDDAYSDLLGGYLDVVETVPESARGTYLDELGERAITQPVAALVSLSISQRLEHFAGEEGRLRRGAISHAINRGAIEAQQHSLESAAHDFTSPILPGYSPELKGADALDYDARAARDLWAEANAISPWKGDFTIVVTSGFAGADQVVSQISRVLRIEVKTRVVATDADLATATTDPERPTAFLSERRVSYPDARAFLAPFASSAASGAPLQYGNPKIDRLLDEAAETSDTEELIGLYGSVQEQLLADLPVIPLWYPTVHSGFGRDVGNVRVDWQGFPIYDQITAAG
ncbi:MAG TPA: ABC transporter substrate-binding protein [Pseudolysinimonas sp.]|nr:ABC transporter substrate-binding protein [Pseudolysinimonas sp.]